MTGSSLKTASAVFLGPNESTAVIVAVIWGLVLFFWIIAIVWTTKDSNARTQSIIKQFWYIILVTIGGPIIGLPLYIALRPARYREKYEGGQSQNAAICLSCGHRNNPHHTHCVFCGEKIHIKCRECHQPYPASYAYCPECGAPNIDQLLKENR